MKSVIAFVKIRNQEGEAVRILRCQRREVSTGGQYRPEKWDLRTLSRVPRGSPGALILLCYSAETNSVPLLMALPNNYRP